VYAGIAQRSCLHGVPLPVEVIIVSLIVQEAVYYLSNQVALPVKESRTVLND